MDKALYDFDAKYQKENWWHISRIKIIETVIKKHIKNLGQETEILDIGSGTGGNFKLLSRFTKNIIGMECNSYARELSQQKYDFQVTDGNLPDNIPFSDESFDLITLFDVLEHVDDDINSLKNILSKIKMGGHILITVPAYQFLWSGHDEINDHKRRYTLNELLAKMKKAGITIKYGSYFNTWLFPLIFAVRFIKSKISVLKDKEDTFLPPKPINSLLKLIMSSESLIIQNGSCPFGVSIIALGYKEKQN